MEEEKGKISLLGKWRNRQKNIEKPKQLKKAPLGALIPLSNGQRRLWFLQQLYPNNPFYNYSEDFSFKGLLNVDKLKQALELIFSENQILHSFYPIEDGNPILKINSNQILKIEEFDFSSFEEIKAQTESDKIKTASAQTHFDLFRPPLFQISLIKLPAQKYSLFITLHHIITDIWSMGIFKKQLAEYYKVLCMGNRPQAKKTELEFSDYAFWDHNRETNQLQLSYWKEKLSGEIPILSLPLDNNRPLQPSFKGKQNTRHYTQSLSNDTIALAKELGVTPYVYLLAVYYILLYKYSGQLDICIGSPISTRSEKRLEDLLGFFLDTVVLRQQIDPSKSFSDFVKEIRKNTLETFTNKDLPFDILVKELKPERLLATNPFFQVMFLYSAETTPVYFGPEVQLLVNSEFDSGVSKFDLTLNILEKNGMLSATFEYDTDLFKEETIVWFQEHLEQLLRGIAIDSTKSLSEIPMLTQREKAHFSQKNLVPPIFEEYTSIHGIIEDVVRTNPKGPALVFDQSSMTYRELNKQADSLAQRLFTITKGKNEIVGLCLDRSLDMIVGILAILKAGCAYLPIDPEYPSERIDYILNDSKASILVTHSSKITKFKNFKNTVLNVDEKENRGSNLYFQKLPIVNRDHLAYVIYTSGSTGKPKGVPITHGNIINSTEGRLNFYPENPKAFLLMSSIAFDSSKAGIYWTLCTGGTLVIAEKRIEQDIEKIVDVIVSNKVSHTLMLPSLYGLLLEHGTILKLSSLSTVMVAGEACASSVTRSHFEKLPKTALYNEYGPTEATVWCIAHQIKAQEKYATIPIGKPVANAQIYLLDENLALMPFGAIGEIYVGGPGLANRYLNRPELDRKAYFKDPFSDNPNDKLYKTGDLGRYQADGNILFLGRADQQVKIRGHRIELDEVENAVLDLVNVEKVAVIVETKAMLKQLIAFVKVDSTAIELEEIKRKLRNRLPDYMIPSRFIKLDSFPLLPNGKIDKKRLTEFEQYSSSNTLRVKTEPTNEIQKKLVEIWQDVLQVASIGTDENFFEIGGDSISSIQIIAKARKSGIALKANQLFEHQTIAELALFVDYEQNVRSPEENIDGEVLLTPIQHWFFEGHTAAPHYWNQIVQLSNIDNVEVSMLKEIILALVSYHDALRLSFIKNESSWNAYVLSPDTISVFKYFDIGNMEDPEMQNQHIKEQTIIEQQNCNLSEGNLFRALYFNCGDQQMPLVYLVAHHLVVDMVSWNSIFSDISSALKQRLQKEQISFKPKSNSIRAWGEFLKKQSESPKLKKELSFWKEQKNSSGQFPIDFDLRSSFIAERTITILESILDAKSTQALLNDANAAYHTKIEDLLLTALSTTICQWAKLETFFLGLERHGRSVKDASIDVSNTVGWFTSFFPFTLLFTKSDDIGERIKSVKEQLRAIPNDGTGYGILKYIAENKPLKNLDQRPQLIFNYLGIQRTSFEESDVSFEYIMENYRDPSSERSYLIEINAYILNNQLRMNWSYSKEVYKAATIQNLADEFIAYLEETIEYCATKEQSNYTPSDFPEAEISQDDLDDLMRRL